MHAQTQKKFHLCRAVTRTFFIIYNGHFYTVRYNSVTGGR